MAFGMKNDDDDEIIGEMPVYLSQELAHNLYLLQYPLRPASRPYSENLGNVSSVRVKPMQKRLEMEFDLPTTHHNYDARNMADVGKTAITKLKLASKYVPFKTNYTAGVIRDGALHLTPLHAVCRMLPCVSHIDDAEDEAKAADKKMFEEKKKEDEVMKPLLVRFNNKKRQSTADNQGHNVTHAYLKATQDREPFVQLESHHPDSAATTNQHECMVCHVPTHVRFDINPEDYLQYINPTPKTPLSAGAAAAAVTAGTAHTIALPEIVKAILQSARVCSFSQLCGALSRHRFGDCVDVESAAGKDMVRLALVECQKSAHLVHGNWVVKSTGLYFGREKQCRDYLITQLRNDAPVDRRQLQKFLQWEYAFAQTLFTNLAIQCDPQSGHPRTPEGRRVRGFGAPIGRSADFVHANDDGDDSDGDEEKIAESLWKFKLETDEKFMRTFVKVTAAQNKILGKMEARLYGELTGAPALSPGKKKTKAKRER